MVSGRLSDHAMSSGTSCLLSTSLFVLLFAAMQVYKAYLTSNQFMTIVGGYLGSLLFILILTALGNLETSLFGKTFQTKLFPEVVVSLVIAMLASGFVHRVCITTCFLFSVVALYYINKISAKEHGQYQAPAGQPTVMSKGRKK